MEEQRPSIGRKYKSLRAELRERVRKGTINALETSVAEEALEMGIRGFSCYFCSRSISNWMYVLEDVKYVKGDKESRATYYVHDTCYQEARRTQYIPLRDGTIEAMLN